MTDRRFIGPVVALGLASAGCASATPPGDWRLVWSDEFEGQALDERKWGIAEDCWGGGNEERQCYASSALAVADGRLRITASREPGTAPVVPDAPGVEHRTLPYRSAKILTRGKASWLHGRFEIRARTPVGQGLWPAFWMLPEGYGYGQGMPAGEIDIMEIVNPGSPCPACEGERENRVWGAIHVGGEQRPGVSAVVPGQPWSDFHTYAVEWTPEGFAWLLDGRPYATAAAAGAPFDRPYYLILNMAVGGRWPEGANARGIDEAAFPATLEIDWVRVWRRAD